ncbi:MAG: electron transfer flavoprotein subunit alpha/FixB family protein, partial [Bacteroidota bacterium]|nr:electron transfer flavoprotein subunit alpha/FixB family protein [Bacteroidota bacterium]
MAILVFVESADGAIKKSSLEAVFYASKLAERNGDSVTAIYIGQIDNAALERIGGSGAKRVLHADNEKLNLGVVQAYTSVLFQAMQKEGADTLILATSSLGNPIAARLAIKLNAGLATNVVDLPETSGGFKVKRSIFTGKAFELVEITSPKKIIAIKKNAVDYIDAADTATVEKFAADLDERDFNINITGTEKATGDVLLP